MSPMSLAEARDLADRITTGSGPSNPVPMGKAIAVLCLGDDTPRSEAEWSADRTRAWWCANQIQQVLAPYKGIDW